jgi:hypothetical protein
MNYLFTWSVSWTVIRPEFSAAIFESRKIAVYLVFNNNVQWRENIRKERNNC